MREQHTFEKGLEVHITERSQDAVFLERVRQQSKGCEGYSHSELDEKEVMSLAREKARMEYLQNNLEWYNQLYFPESASATLPGICDNGGFENDFTNYSGFISTFNRGSNTCQPKDGNGVPSTFVSTILPATDRIEIVTSGTDTLVGIERVKFGNKALRLNKRYGHSLTCLGNTGVDRITKDFVVTDSTREFTVWYALVLENPAGHNNSQPWFSISCDLAPSSDLCFDASILNCADSYADSLCTFDDIDVLDWTCHRIKIPKSEVGNTATLTITVGDWGLADHFGYAYIDGICEECTSSPLGLVNLDSLNNCGFNTEVCRDFSFPDLCGLTWEVDSIYVVGVVADSVVVDTPNQTFCAYFPDTLIEVDSCYDIFVEIIFTDGSNTLPGIASNSIELCRNDLSQVGNVTVGGCNNNSTDDILSDDYYYVTVPIENSTGIDWNIVRELDAPYPNESGIREVASGTGNGLVQLGPFFIQEGSWEMTVTIGDCVYVLIITPPAYCSNDCDEGYELTSIGNISCTPISGTDTYSWSFDLSVPDGTGSVTFWIDIEGDNNYTKSKGPVHKFSGLSLTTDCIRVVLAKDDDEFCQATFYICPSKPCGDCEFEPIIEDIICAGSGSSSTFNVQLEVEAVPGKHLCYKSKDPGGSASTGAPLPTNQILTGFTDSIFLTTYLCDNANCNTGCTPTPECFKSFYVPKPNFGCASSLTAVNERKGSDQEDLLEIFPNPTSGDIYCEVYIEALEYYIIDVTGTVIISGLLKQGRRRLDVSLSSGVYYIICKDALGGYQKIKLIRL